jgi:hypothetical protein
MPPVKKKTLKVLPDYRDGNGTPGFSLRRWDGHAKQYAWAPVPITDDELRIQVREPVRLSSEPKYWLYRNRFVVEEGAASMPDDFIDLLETVIQNTEARHDLLRRESIVREKTKALEQRLFEEGVPLQMRSFELENCVRQALTGIWPKRHSELAISYPEELTLRVKHAVLSEEKSLDKLRREVEAFENFERIRATPREPIPEHIRMFVWQRDRGCCVKCGCQERLEFDHVIPLAKGGSNTERNVQLLCEACNRTKGAGIG